MQKIFSLEMYLECMKIKGVPVKMLQEFQGPSVKIMHECPRIECLKPFPRSPDLMVKSKNGVCPTCSKNDTLRQHRFEAGLKYDRWCLTKGASRPIDQSLFTSENDNLMHLCSTPGCTSIFPRAPAKARRKTCLGVCPGCTRKKKGEIRRYKSEGNLRQVLASSGTGTEIVVFKYNTKVASFRCGKCQSLFPRIPINLTRLQNFFCKACGQQAHSDARSMTHSELKPRLIANGHSCIIVSKGPFNQKTNIEFECGCIDKNRFRRTHGNILRENSAALCVPCSNKAIGARCKRSNEKYDADLLSKRSGILRLGDYIDNQTAILHKCVCHNDQWLAQPNNVLKGALCGCGKGRICEEVVRYLFEQMFGQKFPRRRAEYLKTAPMRLGPFDGRNAELKINFEHHGSQHYDWNKLFHKTYRDFVAQKVRDYVKIMLSEINGDALIIVPTLEYVVRKMRNSTRVADIEIGKIVEMCENAGLALVTRKPTIDWQVIDRRSASRKKLKSSNS